jgi:magnesium transporter
MPDKKVSKKIEQLVINNPAQSNKIDWFNIVNAGKNELEFIRRRFGFNMTHIHASTATSFSQRPMALKEDKYVFLILHFPFFSGNKIRPAEIDFFIGHGYLITLHNGNLPALTNFFHLAKKDAARLDAYRFESSAILLAEILEKLIADCYQLIDKNSRTIETVEDIIFSDGQKKAISVILNLRHNIINIRKILQNHKNILQKLMDLKSSVVPSSEIRDHYHSLVEHSKRIWEALDNQKEMIEALASTNQALTDDRMTGIMKTLTIISVIVFPLTLLATIFSMKTVNTPLVGRPSGFWLIIGLMALIGLIMLAIFKNKKWL